VTPTLREKENKSSTRGREDYDYKKYISRLDIAVTGEKRKLRKRMRRIIA
jgi:hypothetical protein